MNKIVKIVIVSAFLPLFTFAQHKQEKNTSGFKSDTAKTENQKNNINLTKDQNQNDNFKKNKKNETPNKLKNQPQKEVNKIKNTGNYKQNTKISKKKIGKTSR